MSDALAATVVYTCTTLILWFLWGYHVDEVSEVLAGVWWFINCATLGLSWLSFAALTEEWRRPRGW